MAARESEADVDGAVGALECGVAVMVPFPRGMWLGRGGGVHFENASKSIEMKRVGPYNPNAVKNMRR
jgi:hypothetical protein